MAIRRISLAIAALVMLALGGAGAHADTVLTGKTSSLVLSDDGSKTIINRSTFAPTITQSATNRNVNSTHRADATGTGDVVGTGPAISNSAQGISNAQHAGVESGGGTTIINRSTFAPSITQNATNTNANNQGGRGSGSGDVFATAPSSTNNAQGINNTQNAALSVQGGTATLIINRTAFAPAITQSATNGQLLLTGL